MKNIEEYIAELSNLLEAHKAFSSLVFMKKRNPLKKIGFESETDKIDAKEFEPIWFKKVKAPVLQDELMQLEQLICTMEKEGNTSYMLKDTVFKKGLLLSIPLRFDAFHIGYIVCFFNQKKIDQLTINTIQSISNFICNSLQKQYLLNKKSMELESAKKNLAASSKIINSLKIRLEEKSLELESAQNSNVKEVKINWQEESRELDEVWLTMQGYSNESTEPVVSKWCKIQDLNVYDQVNTLFNKSHQLKEVKIA